MRNKELYDSTVDIILDAYNNKKLMHGSACGCFIGNIVEKRCKNLDYKDIYLDGNQVYTAYWYDVISNHYAKTNVDLKELVKEQIDSTGYTVEEVIALEQAFESAISIEKRVIGERGLDIGQYEGMKAALKKLAEIHETPATESIEKLDKIQETVYA